MSGIQLTPENQNNINSFSENFNLMSVNAVRKLLKVRHSTVEEFIRQGKLKAIKMNDRYKIPKIFLEEFFRNSKLQNLENQKTNFESSNIKEKINELINKNKRN